MSELANVQWQLAASLPDNRNAYRVLVNGKTRLVVYVSATGRSVRVFDGFSDKELKVNE